jgi:hypothetical protein
MQQRMDSMATAIVTLNVELNNSRQASQCHPSWSQAKKSSSGRSKGVKKKKKQKQKTCNTTSDDDDDDDDESAGSSTGTSATPMPIMDNFNLRTFYLADGSTMLPVATSDPRLTDQVDYRRYRLKKRKGVLRSEKAKRLTRPVGEIHQRMTSLYLDGSEPLAVLGHFSADSRLSLMSQASQRPWGQDCCSTLSEGRRHGCWNPRRILWIELSTRIQVSSNIHSRFMLQSRP